jgi:3',5'-nucleoside bisphosphate phosphatase
MIKDLNFRADLHSHSNFSDGSDTPEELIRLAIDAGLSGLSITDHDTLEAYSRAIPFAGENQFPLLSGIEFSASYRGDSVHILAYAFPLASQLIHQLCEKHAIRRRNRNRKILKNLNNLGISVTQNEFEKQDQNRTLGRPHIATLLIEKGIVKSVKEAFDKFLAEGKPAYDPGELISVEETLQVIHESRGKAIIAHPHLIKRLSTQRAIVEMPFDGLEGHYPRMAPSQKKQWHEIAKNKGWIITGGSDYHGKIKPLNRLGSDWVDSEIFNELFEHFQAQSAKDT